MPIDIGDVDILIYHVFNQDGECIASTESDLEARDMAFECGGYWSTEWVEVDNDN